MSEALSLMLDFARKVEQLKEVGAWTHRDNSAARRLLERHGFERDLDAESKAAADDNLKSYVIYSRRLVPFVQPDRLETTRLRQMPFTEGDAQFILQLLNTDGWKRYIGDRGVTDEASAIAYLQRSPMRLEREQGMSFIRYARKTTDPDRYVWLDPARLPAGPGPRIRIFAGSRRERLRLRSRHGLDPTGEIDIRL